MAGEMVRQHQTQETQAASVVDWSAWYSPGHHATMAALVSEAAPLPHTCVPSPGTSVTAMAKIFEMRCDVPVSEFMT